MPDRIKREVNVLDRHKEIAICGTWGNAIGENGKTSFSLKSPTGFVLKYNYWKPSPFISSSVIIRGRILKENSFNNSLQTAEDYDLWVRILKFNKGYNISNPLVKYRVHKAGISKTLPDNSKNMSLKSFIKNFQIEDISLETYLSLTCLEFKLSPIKRFYVLWKFKTKLGLPFWFLMLDSIYYACRKILFSIKPEFQKYR
jgi:hypothetical protein